MVGVGCCWLLFFIGWFVGLFVVQFVGWLVLVGWLVGFEIRFFIILRIMD